MKANFHHLLYLFLLCGASKAALACDQTLSVGANVASAVASAPNGSTICLNNGNYGTVNLFDISRSGYVTLTSTNRHGAQIKPNPGNGQYVKFQGLTIPGGLSNSCSKHVQWIDNVFTGTMTLSNNGCSNMDLLFDGNTFNDINVGGDDYEGRLSVVYGCPSGVTIRNNTFSGGVSDGIQVLGGACNVQIGPGNVFSNILESRCGSVHCDAIQFYGAGANNVIEGNYFKSGDTYLMMPDGSSGVTVRNNVFDGGGVSYEYKLQFGSASNLLFEHNTVYNASVAIDSKSGSSASTNATVRNNIISGYSQFKTSGGSGCSNCTFSTNLFDDSGSLRGSPTLVGAPSYVGGGTNPSTWTGFQLTTSSLGARGATDGLDIGSTFFGGSASPSPPPPIQPSSPSALVVQ